MTVPLKRQGESALGAHSAAVLAIAYRIRDSWRRLIDTWPDDPAFGWPGLVVVTASLSFLYLALFILPDTPRLTHGDQYINFDNARRMAQGQSLYTDIFQYTLPGTEWLFYILIKLFGPRFAMLQATQVVTGVLTVWLGLVIGSRVLRGWTAVLPCLLFLVFALRFTLDETHHKFSVLLIYAAVAVLIRGRGRLRLAVVGWLCGMAACFTQTRVLMLPMLGAFTLWVDWRECRQWRRVLSDALWLTVPLAAVLGLVCGYMIAHVGFARFWYLVVDFPLKYYRNDVDANTWAVFLGDYPPPSLTLVGFMDWIGIKLLIPFIYVPVGFHLWQRHRRREDDEEIRWNDLLLVLLTGVGLFATIGYAPVWQRLCEIALPAFIALVWRMEASRVRPLGALAWGLGAAMLIAVPIRVQTKTYCFMAAPAGTIANFYPNSCHAYQWLFNHVHPGDYFFGPYDPISDVILDTRDPVPYPYIINDGYMRRSQVQRTVESLQQYKPRFIAGWMNPADYDDPGDRLYPFGEFLRGNYRLRKTFPNGYQVWECRNLPNDDPKSATESQ